MADETRPVMSRYKRLESLRSQLETERTSFISQWRELGDFILPRRGRFTIGTSRGNINNNKIIDSTAMFSARTLSSGMMSGLTSPARPWFRLTIPDPELRELESVKDWLHVVTQRMNTVFSRSNLYKHLPNVYLDVGTFATGAIGVFEDPDTVIRCETYPIGSYMIANDEKYRVRVFMRVFQMTVEQIVKKFGGDPENPNFENISEGVKTAWERKEFQKWFGVVHCIFPNDYYDGESKLSKRKKYAQVYYEQSTDVKKGTQEEKLLEETGFDEFPIMVMRWQVSGEDVYGTDSPGMLALGDIKMLQHGEKKAMQALDKLVNPPMVGPSSLRNAKASILPGDITYYDAQSTQNTFKPAHEVRPDLGSLEQKQEGVRYRIKRAFYEDLFLLLGSNPALDDVQRTAREIEERHEEKFLALGPVVEQGSDDLLDPLIDRTFAIMLRKGLIPEAPEELQGESLKVEYISIMAQAQKSLGLAGLERLAMFAGNISKVKPDVLDKLDFDQMIDEYGESGGTPPRVIVPDEDVAKMRAQRAQQAQAAQSAATMKDGSVAALNLSRADTTKPNALTDLMRVASQNPPEAGAGVPNAA